VDGRALAPLSIACPLPGREIPVLVIAKLFAPRLETVDPGFGIEVVTMMALAVEPILLPDVHARPGQVPRIPTLEG